MVQRMPAHFMRWPTTFLHAASMTPEPIGSPAARCSRSASGRAVRRGRPALRHSSTSPPHQHGGLHPTAPSRSTSGLQFALRFLQLSFGKARGWELSLYESWASGCRVRSILFMRVWPPPASTGLQAFPLRCAGVGRDGMVGGVQRRGQQFNGLAEVGCDSLDAAVRWNHDHRQPSRGLELHPHVWAPVRRSQQPRLARGVRRWTCRPTRPVAHGRTTNLAAATQAALARPWARRIRRAESQRGLALAAPDELRRGRFDGAHGLFAIHRALELV